MKLISAIPSPFGRKVKVLIQESGQSDDVEVVLVATAPTATAAEVAAANPVGKLPALIREDGPALYDSRVICRYLDERANAGFYPQARIWDTLVLEATADGILDAALLMVYEHRLRPEEQISSDWVEAQWAKAHRAVGAINERWMSHLNGPMDMGQIAVACALGYLDFRLGDRDWRGGNDALAAWYEEFSKRDSMISTRPE